MWCIFSNFLNQLLSIKTPIEKYTWQKATPTHDHSAFQKENAFVEWQQINQIAVR